MDRGRGDRRRTAQIVAVAVAGVAAVVVLVVPAYTNVTESSDGRIARSTQTLIEVNGPWVIGLALVPVALAGAPLLVRGRAQRPTAIVATLLLVLFVVVSGFSIGLFFLPAAICAATALVLPSSSVGAGRSCEPEPRR